MCCVEGKNDLSFKLPYCLHLSSSEMEQRLNFHWLKAILLALDIHLPDMIAGCLLAGKLWYAAAVAADGHLAQGSLHLAGCHRLRLRNNLLKYCSTNIRLFSLHSYRPFLSNY
jgi:hypothetical protein